MIVQQLWHDFDVDVHVTIASHESILSNDLQITRDVATTYWLQPLTFRIVVQTFPKITLLTSLAIYVLLHFVHLRQKWMVIIEMQSFKK